MHVKGLTCFEDVRTVDGILYATHKMFAIPLNLPRDEPSACRVEKDKAKGKLLEAANLILWDEITMSQKENMEAVDKTMIDCRDDRRVMKGCVVVFAGDFRQTLPVVPRGQLGDQYKASLKSSRLWSRNLEQLKLTENVRASRAGHPDAKDFARSLLELGDGLWPVDEDDGKITFPENFGIHVTTLQQLIANVYGNVHQRLGDIDWLVTRAILTPTNAKVRDINEDVMASIKQDTHTYVSMDSIPDPDEAVHYQPDLLNTLRPAGLPEHKIKLKVGVPIMILRNLDPPRLCNGTRAVVTHMYRNCIAVRIMTGAARGEIALIPRIPMKAENCYVEFYRRQLPISVAFAIAINKSQGQTLDVVGVDLRESCFSHGQLYVACSRVGRPDNLIILSADRRTKNVVYRPALQDPHAHA